MPHRLSDDTVTSVPAGDLLPNPGFSRTFAPGALTLGFILPLESYPNGPVPTLTDHVELTRLADCSGFAALWARDVPTLDPNFGDAGQVLDPFVYLGFLAANTRQIALATGAAIITLRHPVHVAKQAGSVDMLSGGRLLLGVASGDRPTEYPLFGLEDDYDRRGERFREALAMIRLASEEHFPVGRFDRFGQFEGQLDVLPKPVNSRLPLVVVGRSRQDLAWLARHSDAWLYYFVDPRSTRLIVDEWRAAVAEVSPGQFKPFAQGLFLDLLEDPNAPARPIHAGMAAGRHALIRHLETLREIGVNHVAFNLKSSHRPARDVIEELGTHVVPVFPAHS